MNEFKKLSLADKSTLLDKMADDYLIYLDSGSKICPNKQQFTISLNKARKIPQEARLAAFYELNKPGIKKFAFDTRRVDQELSRNPRINLQYWHRSEAFITESDEHKLRIFAKLMKELTSIKKDFGAQPEWFESYARILHDNVYRILRVKEGDLDIFKPQLSYLEQLIFARYNLSMEELSKLDTIDLRKKILAKDESLLKRGAYLEETGLPVSQAENGNKQIVIDGNGNNNTQENIINAIFGNNNIRRESELETERTITITIKDKVIK